LGISLDIRQERTFINRYGAIIKEDILHFINYTKLPQIFVLNQAKNIALAALESAYSLADEQVKAEIKDAINKVDKVESSPYFDRQRSRKKHELINQKEKNYV